MVNFLWAGFFDFGQLGGPKICAAPCASVESPHPGSYVAAVLQLCNRSFIRCFFESIFDRSWLDFPSQFTSQSSPKSSKNRCQEPFYLGLRISIDFSSILAVNLDPPNFESSGFSRRKNANFQKSAFRKSYRFFIDFGTNLPPFSFPKSIKIP